MLTSILSNKWILYAIIGVFSLSIIANIVGNIKEMRKEPTYTKEAVELMIKHAKLKEQIEQYKQENELLKKDYTKIVNSITEDSLLIHNSDRAYRDSLRNYLFNRVNP